MHHKNLRAEIKLISAYNLD